MTGTSPNIAYPAYTLQTPLQTPLQTDTPVASFLRTREDAKDVKTFYNNVSNTRARELKEREELEEVSELDAIVDEWQDSHCFAKLDFRLISELDVLLKKHGSSAIRDAMDKARLSNNNRNGVSFNYFKAVLDNTKGGRTVERIDNNERDSVVEFLGYDPCRRAELV